MPSISVRAISACRHSSSLMLCDTPRRYCEMPMAAATIALTIVAYRHIDSSLLASATALLYFRSPHRESDLVDLPGESSLRADADALGDRCLIVHPDVSRLVGGEDVG